MIIDVLVFTPVLRLEPETVKAIFELEWEGPLSFLLRRYNPTGNGHVDHLHQYQHGREAFLQGPYDAMLIIESDIIPPPDTLKRLAALDADCAYGVYQLRASPVVNVFERYPGKPRNIGESLTCHPEKWWVACAKGRIEISGGGLGCVLIKRHVLETISFRPGDGSWCDTYFSQDVLRVGYTQIADMHIVCGHKDVTGEILWPIIPRRKT